MTKKAGGGVLKPSGPPMAPSVGSGPMSSLAKPAVPPLPVERRMFKSRAMATPSGTQPGFKKGGKTKR